MPITIEIVTSIDENLAEKLRGLYIQKFKQLPLYGWHEQLVLEATFKEIQFFNEPDGGRHAVIAKDNGQIVGLILIDLPKDKDGILHLTQGAILKSHQGQGVVKEMLKTFLTLHFKIAGAFTLTSKDHHAAAQFCEKNGATKNLKIYSRFQPFDLFEISPPLVKKHYPGIRFKFSGMNDVAITANEERNLTPIRSCL